MAQALLIGLGGTGSRVVNETVKLLKANGQSFNDGQICCAVLDTNLNDTGAIIKSGTEVPVFETSKPQRIADYLLQYQHLNVLDWSPVSARFGRESMVDGASEVRMKSRIAFMDCLETGVMDRLELLINDVLKCNTGSKIRIMIISSLSGGTGSGMFIQVALWLRKKLNRSQIMIRGIFLLPDVFVSTLKDIRDNPNTKIRHYANAYAAIRELNALSKIMKNNTVDLPERVTLGDLFDSEKDAGSGEQIYDLPFFVDDIDENGVRLNSLNDYERMVAQLTYMQLFSPMKDDMYSEEDNTFLTFDNAPEPVYGSCGTSKAEYPVESVQDYCKIRAAKEAIQSGWCKIDDEIEARKEELKQARKDGIFSNEEIDPKTEYIRIYEEKVAQNSDNTGSDRFFLTISKDSKNEQRVKNEKTGNIEVIYTDKVEDFLNLLKKNVIDKKITELGLMDEFGLNDAFVTNKHTKQQLIKQVKGDEAEMESCLDEFDKQIDKYARAIVDSVFPFSMGNVNQSNERSLYGFLTKLDADGKRVFVHPVSARYLMYRLAEAMRKENNSIILSADREIALAGGDVGTKFDDKKTKKIEQTPLEFLNSTRFVKNDAFYDEFERRYVEFINTKIRLCEKYEKEALQISVFKALIERINALSAKMEVFFQQVEDIKEELKGDLEKNIQKTETVQEKTIYVYGKRANKEAIYDSLNLDDDKKIGEINKSVIDAVYGRLCAEKRPSIEENKSFKVMSASKIFKQEILNTFKSIICDNPDNQELTDLDIYTAICKEADDIKKSNKSNEDEEPIGDVQGRHESAFINCKNRLLRLAAPCLVHRIEVSDSSIGSKTMREKTFWGFHKDVVNAYSNIGSTLGINAEQQADEAYPKNALYCYRAVYGIEAQYIPKFNELGGGEYFTCYHHTITEMSKKAAGREGESALVNTPHLDKRWHRILPYTTKAMEETSEKDFYRGFWLALAYRNVDVNNTTGRYTFIKDIDSGFGTTITVKEEIVYKGRPIGKTEIASLITALKTDSYFREIEIPLLEKRFQNELRTMENYVGTEALKGLINSNESHNPIDIIVRYNESRNRRPEVSAALVGALEDIAGQMAEQYNMRRSAEQDEEAKYRICRRIYDSSSRVQGKEEIFSAWIQKFGIYKIAKETKKQKPKASKTK